MFQKRKDAIKYDSTVKLIGFPILMFLLTNLAIAGLTSFLTELVFPVNASPISLGSTIAMILNVLLSVVLMLFLGKIKLKDLGFSSKSVLKNILIGIVSGFVILSIVALIIKVLGAVTIKNVFQTSHIKVLLIGLVFFMFQGTFEELVFRSYIMTHFAKKWGDLWGILLSSVLFVLIHALNPGITVIPIINLFVASIVFSLIYYIWGNLWLTGLAHGIWNYSQGFIYGSLVSGQSLKGTVFTSMPVDNMNIISGGSFGFEGSIITTITGIIISVILLFVIKKKNQ